MTQEEERWAQDCSCNRQPASSIKLSRSLSNLSAIPGRSNDRLTQRGGVTRSHSQVQLVYCVGFEQPSSSSSYNTDQIQDLSAATSRTQDGWVPQQRDRQTESE